MDESSRYKANGLVDSLRDSWARVLEVSPEEIDNSSHFFESGGDSLLAVELVVGLSDSLGVTVPLDSVMLDGTFGGLRAACQRLVPAGDADGRPGKPYGNGED